MNKVISNRKSISRVKSKIINMKIENLYKSDNGCISFCVKQKDITNISKEMKLDIRHQMSIDFLSSKIISDNFNVFLNIILNLTQEDYDREIISHDHRKFAMKDENGFSVFSFHISFLHDMLSSHLIGV